MNHFICNREIEATDSNNQPIKLRVKMTAPFPDERDGGDWACSFELTGFEKTVNKTFYGVDSFQALIHCIIGINAHLNYYARAKQLKITWFEMEDLGFSTKWGFHLIKV